MADQTKGERDEPQGTGNEEERIRGISDQDDEFDDTDDLEDDEESKEEGSDI